MAWPLGRSPSLLLVLAVAAGCVAGSRPLVKASRPSAPMAFDLELPAGFARPLEPANNRVTAAKVELGRHLFFDTALSRDGSFSCASCHRPELAFTDGRRTAVGVTGEVHPRNTMTLANVAYAATLNWADPRTRTLERQMLVPMFGEEPVELGLQAPGDELLARLAARGLYRRLFADAYPDDAEPLTLANLTAALASFERTLISGNSPFDRYVYWDEAEGFSPAARRGMELFFSDGLGCSECHAGFNLSAPALSVASAEPVLEFHNTGLFDVDGEGSYPLRNRGVLEHTGRRRDMGRFKAPTLRNVELTAPYMHDGSFATLEEVVEHYASGGRPSPYKSDRVSGFELTAAERQDLVEFLLSLTDRRFVEWAIGLDPFRSAASEADRGAEGDRPAG